MTERAIAIEGAGAIAGVELLPALNDRGILVGLPGGDVYLRRDVELGLIAERRLHDLATVRALKLGEFIRDTQARKHGLPRVRPNIEAAKDELRRERARASGLEVPAAPDKPSIWTPAQRAYEEARLALRKFKGLNS